MIKNRLDLVFAFTFFNQGVIEQPTETKWGFRENIFLFNTDADIKPFCACIKYIDHECKDMHLKSCLV